MVRGRVARSKQLGHPQAKLHRHCSSSDEEEAGIRLMNPCFDSVAEHLEV